MTGKPCKAPEKAGVYPNRHRAEQAIETIRRSPNRGEVIPTRAYLCECGRHWHITSQP